MAGEADKVREHLNNNRLQDALTLARRLSRAAPGDAALRALLLEVLFTKGEHDAVNTELAALERSGVAHQELQKLRARFKKRG